MHNSKPTIDVHVLESISDRGYFRERGVRSVAQLTFIVEYHQCDFIVVIFRVSFRNVSRGCFRKKETPIIKERRIRKGGKKRKEKKVHGKKDDGGRFFELSLGRVISKGVENGEKVWKLRSLDKARALPLLYHDFILWIVQLICLYTRVLGRISNHS